jgi:hypothetical protein
VVRFGFPLKTRTPALAFMQAASLFKRLPGSQQARAIALAGYTVFSKAYSFVLAERSIESLGCTLSVSVVVGIAGELMGGQVKEVAVNNVSIRRSSMCSARAIGERDGTFSILLRPWRDHCYVFSSFFFRPQNQFQISIAERVSPLISVTLY